MSRFEQHAPRPLRIHPVDTSLAPTAPVPRIAIVTPSYNQRHYLIATVASVLAQNYPALSYHVQDAASQDGTVDLLQSYGPAVSWRSEPDTGQANAINTGFRIAAGDCEIMAYLNSDDTLLPGTLAYVAQVFQSRPDVDIVYGHRIFIDGDGMEIGRAVFPAHDARALNYIGYVPQETMFWRRRVWERIGPIDENFRFALDWDFMLRAQHAGFRMVRMPRFLGCFRIHPEQKTSAMMGVGLQEMQLLRQRHLGHIPTRSETYRAVAPFLLRQFVWHWLYRLQLLKY
ncbi:glycosyltransferase involved in cell wall biosynthesis [Nitrobacteraceae bacterium AZCC 2161]